MKIAGPGRELTEVFPGFIREIMKRQSGELKKGNITAPQMIILELLCQKKQCSMGEITKALAVTKAGATGLVDRMIKSGLVKRARIPEDRRVVTIFLTSKGESTAKHIVGVREKALMDIFSFLNETEKKEYVRMLKKIYQGLLHQRK